MTGEGETPTEIIQETVMEKELTELSASLKRADRLRLEDPENVKEVTFVDKPEMRNFARQPSRVSQASYGACNCGTRFTPAMEDKLRRRLRFFFMNPCEKWRARRRFPWKLVLQIFKIVIVTIQLTVFGTDRASHVSFVEKNTVAFKHLFLKNWDTTFETMPYPPTNGPFAVYTIPELANSINYIMKRYNETRTLAIGSYDFSEEDGSKPPMKICFDRYKLGEISAHNETYHFDAGIMTECANLTAVNKCKGNATEPCFVFDIIAFLDEHNSTLNLDNIVSIKVSFSLKSIHLKRLTQVSSPDCFEFNILILYDNSGHSGQCPVTLKSVVDPLKCSKESNVIHASENYLKQIGTTVLDVLVIFISASSFILCFRSLIRAEQLKKLTVKYFFHRENRRLNFYETSEFLNLWHVLILINDTLTVIGSSLKIQIESKNSQNYDVCSLLLGTGNLLVWIGVLRYLSFFDHYNILILTMKKSLPDITRFIICAAVLYLGFTFCGWVVLGPYHIKFREIGTASECLFSLVNGDDMFVTFSAIEREKSVIYIYSRIYLYVFISLFMYVVYSLFTSIIINTYDTIKGYYTEGFPKSIIQEFIDRHSEDVDSPLYRSDSGHNKGCICCMLPCFESCCRSGDHYPDEYTNIINS
ncbi:mucolipin-3-like isoform X2 [Lineus longissimus]|uniref:mucolipin-3-like isoform X2 n=1 Tax=Lineus longissimus TaxID=88925 RepID=UPI00315D7007